MSLKQYNAQGIKLLVQGKKKEKRRKKKVFLLFDFFELSVFWIIFFLTYFSITTDLFFFSSRYHSFICCSVLLSCRQTMINSGLNQAQLGSIWNLSDLDKDGCLDRVEFALCMYLMEEVAGGAEIPNELPKNYIPPSKRNTGP